MESSIFFAESQASRGFILGAVRVCARACVALRLGPVAGGGPSHVPSLALSLARSRAAALALSLLRAVLARPSSRAAAVGRHAGATIAVRRRREPSRTTRGFVNAGDLEVLLRAAALLAVADEARDAADVLEEGVCLGRPTTRSRPLLHAFCVWSQFDLSFEYIFR